MSHLFSFIGIHVDACANVFVSGSERPTQLLHSKRACLRRAIKRILLTYLISDSEFLTTTFWRYPSCC